MCVDELEQAERLSYVTFHTLMGIVQLSLDNGVMCPHAQNTYSSVLSLRGTEKKHSQCHLLLEHLLPVLCHSAEVYLTR